MNSLLEIIFGKSGKVFLPADTSPHIGGPKTFITNFKSYLKRINYKYLTSPKGAKVGFIVTQDDIETIQIIKRTGGKIIQRLDGIHYPEQHGDKYIEMNALAKEIYTKFSDYIVFQTEYSRQQCFALFGEKSTEIYEIIMNGVDSSIFYPVKDHRFNQEKIKFITTPGTLRKKIMIEPIVNALDSLQTKYNFELHIIGNHIPEVEEFLERDYIIQHGHQSLEYIAKEVRSSDIYLHSHINDNCPNAVLEAVASGVPVVGFNTGGMKEILSFSTDLLAYVSEDIFQVEEDFKFERLAEKIEKSIVSYDKYKKLSMGNYMNYSFVECGSKYVKVFEKVLKLVN